MPTLVQLSDIHFGPFHNSHLDDLILSEITALNPDVVIGAGDFTMRARYTEFEQARAFLDKIPKPALLVPGNHDQPIFDPLERLTRQYARYQKYIHPEINATLDAKGWFVLGLNDNHPIFPGGFWSRQQYAWVAERLAAAPRNSVKVVVSHHQFMWGGRWRPAGFWFPMRTLELLARSGVELVLNGHTHVPSAEQTQSGVVVARAGTVASGRIRHGNGNSFNFISVDENQIQILVHGFDAQADAFVVTRTLTFPRRVEMSG